MRLELTEEQRFVLAAGPTAWLDCAEELRDSAAALWEHEDEPLIVMSDGLGSILKKPLVSRTYILLAGFSIENLAKGILVAKDPSLVAHGRLGGQLKTHDLLKLMSGIDEHQLTKEEVEFCKVAQQATPYWGRYPVPLRAHEMAPEVVATARLHPVFVHLFDALNSILRAMLEDGWQGPHDMRLTEYSSSSDSPAA